LLEPYLGLFEADVSAKVLAHLGNKGIFSAFFLFLLAKKLLAVRPVYGSKIGHCYAASDINIWADVINCANLGMEVMHECNIHNFPLDLASVKAPVIKG
jgi:hypothetical protein